MIKFSFFIHMDDYKSLNTTSCSINQRIIAGEIINVKKKKINACNFIFEEKELNLFFFKHKIFISIRINTIT